MPVTTAKDNPAWWPALRFVLGAGGALVLAVGTFALGFAGFVAFAGCFMDCIEPDPNRAGGVVLMLVASVAAGGAMTSLVAGIAGAEPPLRGVFLVSTAVAAIAATLVLLLS